MQYIQTLFTVSPLCFLPPDCLLRRFVVAVILFPVLFYFSLFSYFVVFFRRFMFPRFERIRTRAVY